MSQADTRLPSLAEPRHYELELEPDIEAATFRGHVRIHLDVTTATDQLVCNAADLTIDSAVLEVGGERVALESHIDAERERLSLRAPSPIEPGSVVIEIAYAGVLNDDLRGFYRSSYRDADDVEHTIATTQFQSTDARRGFPCWDEPAYKATFAISLIVADSLLAISNSAIIADEPLGDGRRRVRFADTIAMSTYLVAFVIGPLGASEPVDVDGVPVRVIHRPDQGHLTSYALDVAAHALRYFDDYYGIPYPSDKLDLVAIPDFAFGAMENLGCVTFREVLLLVDPDHASEPELKAVADVVNHEIAHMWFGNLVTMRWWEGIWLNEAFATFMETMCSDHYRPEWDVWTSFGRSRSAAFDVDALAATRPIEYPVDTPEEAEGMFDVLTYEKGASVVRMLEQFLGADRFRDGVRSYLQRHAYGNTETSDLWDALEDVTGEPVRRIMDGWIYQGGHPVLDVTRHDDRIVIAQRHHTLDPTAADERTWAVPVRLRLGQAGSTTEERVLVDRSQRDVIGSFTTVHCANVAGSGFYRVSHDSDSLVDAPGDRIAVERHTLVDDTWSLTVSGDMTAARFIELAEQLAPAETDLTVWQAIIDGLRGVDRIVPDTAALAFRTRLTELFEPIGRHLGFDPSPEDTPRIRELRAAIVGARGNLAHDSDVVDRARRLMDADDITLAAAALSVVARHGGEPEFDLITALARDADDPQSYQRHLRALTGFPDIDLVQRVVDDILAHRIRSQDGPYLLRQALSNRAAGHHVWRQICEHWDELVAYFPSNSIARMLDGIVALDDSETAAEVAAFLDHHPVPQGALQVAQHLEHQRINVAFRAREADALAAWLSG